jgi:uncharacterized protein
VRQSTDDRPRDERPPLGGFDDENRKGQTMTDKNLTAEVKVIDNPQAHRYEAWVNGDLAGFARYNRTPSRITFVHTEVRPMYEGHGVATALARASLDEVRAQGLAVRAVCPFYAAWIAHHLEYQDLLSAPAESRPSEG